MLQTLKEFPGDVIQFETVRYGLVGHIKGFVRLQIYYA